MAGRPQVSIRLGTTGRGDVERDFAAIGDSGDAQAKRYQASWERASAGVESALDRQAKAAARLQAVGATPMQQQINQSTGVNVADTGNAKAAAAALAAQLDQAEKEARQLIASIDPLFAANARYEAQVERINAVRATGQLDEQRYQQLLAHEKGLLDEATIAGERNAQMNGQRRQGMQQLGYQLGDISTQMAMGTRASVIFAQQSGQTIQAIQLMGGEGNKFLNFLRGPWGIALSVAAIALTPLIGKLFDTAESVDSLVEKLKKQHDQQDLNDQANRAYANTTDGVTDALRKNKEALDNIIEGERSAATKALASAEAELARQQGIIQTTKLLISQAQAQLELNNAQALGPETKNGRADPNLAAADAARNRLAQLQADLPQQLANLEDARAQITTATAAVYAAAVEKDPVERIKDRYKQLVDDATRRATQEAASAKAAGDQARSQALVTTELQKQIIAIDRKRDAEIKSYQDSHKTGPANAGGTAIFDDQIANFLDIAGKYRGMSETKDRSTLKSFLGDVDPEKTAWCAAFVNAVLAAGGVHGSGSLAASSFLNFGKDDTRSPQKGDVVVVKSSGSPSGEHVGFLQSIDAKGNVEVLGGNTGNKVGTSRYSASQVLAVRRPPTPSESAANDDKAAQAADREAAKALAQLQTYDSERERLNQQTLAAVGRIASGADQQASVQLQRAQSAHEAEAQDILTNLAAGKYGDATSQLAQSRAQQLRVANDQLLAEQKAAIATESYAKTLQTQDAANEQSVGFYVDALQYQQSMAKTAKERRDLQLQIIDIQFDEKKTHLEYLKALADLAGKTDDAAKIQAEINNLPAEKARAKGAANDNNQTPFEAYRDSLPDLSQASENVQDGIVTAVKSLSDGLADALVKSKNLHDLWKNMKSVFHDAAQQLLKDLIELAIKMLVIKPIMNAIAGGGGGFAVGTEYFGGGAAWVGEHGPEMVSLPRGSKIHTATTSQRLAAANDGGPSVMVPINIDATGADAAGLARVEGALQDLRAELPGLVVQHWSNANTRFVFAGARR